LKISILGPLGSLRNLESLAVYASTIPKFPKFPKLPKFPTTKKPYPTLKQPQVARPYLTLPYPKNSKNRKNHTPLRKFCKNTAGNSQKNRQKILVRKNIPQNPSEYFCKKPNTGFVFIKTNLIFAVTITN